MTLTTPITRRTDVRALLQDRVLLLGAEPHLYRKAITDGLGGAVFAGQEAAARIKQVGHDFPHPVAIEPTSASKRFADTEDPFGLVAGSLFPIDLGHCLDQQRYAGADFAITPTGYFQVGDPDPLKVAVEAANELERSDTVFLATVDVGWCREPGSKQLLAILKRSKHPVALALGAVTDPSARSGVTETIRRLAGELEAFMVWRSDLAAFDAMAHGAFAAAVGIRPSQRLASKPGGHPIKIDPSDRSPAILLLDLMRYVRGRELARWYAASPPPGCDCRVCGGLGLGRYFTMAEDSMVLEHNAEQLYRLAETMPAAGLSRQDWWAATVTEAIAHHDRVSAHLQVRINPPVGVKNWAAKVAAPVGSPPTRSSQ